MKLLGSLTSPYVRLIRTLCDELQLPYQLELTQPFLKLTREEHLTIKERNPLFRVPVLIDGETEVFESRIIASYLLQKPGARRGSISFPLSVEQENVLSAIYGAIEAGVTKFVLSKSDASIDTSKGYFPRFDERMRSTFEWLEAKLQGPSPSSLGEAYGICEMALVCCMEWMKKRGIYQWEGNYPHVVAVYERFKNQHSLVKTRIPENA